MKDIENIPKTNIFKVPSGYFETLPVRTQKRLFGANRETINGFQPFFFISKLAVIVVVALVASLLFKSRPSPTTVNSLASVSTTDIVNYLQEEDLNCEDLADIIFVNYDFTSKMYIESLTELNAEETDIAEYELFNRQSL